MQRQTLTNIWRGGCGVDNSEGCKLVLEERIEQHSQAHALLLSDVEGAGERAVVGVVEARKERIQTDEARTRRRVQRG